MRHSLRRIPALPLALLVAAVLIGGCGAGWTQARYTAEMTVTAPADAPRGLLVEARNGRVDIERAERDGVQVVATVKARSQERADAVLVHAEPTGDAVRVWADWPSKPKSGEGCSFEIFTPGTSHVEAMTSNGSITLTGLGGEAILRTSNGRVTVSDHDGRVIASSSNGRIDLADIRGDVEAETNNGRVTATGLGGAARVDTTNGRVTLRLLPSAAGPVRVDTSNGAIHVTVGPAFAGLVEMDTSNGGVSINAGGAASLLEVKRTQARIRLGTDETRSVLSTSNGSIRFDVVEQDGG